MGFIEAYSFWISVLTYAVCTGLYLYALVFKNEKAFDRTAPLIAFGLVLQTISIAARWWVTGHVPVQGNFENAMGSTWFVILFTLYVAYQRKGLRILGAVTLPFSLIVLGFGWVSSPEHAPFEAAMKSSWLYVHVLFAWLSYGAYSLAFGSGIVYLFKERAEKRQNADTGPVYSRTPPLPRLDELTFRCVIFGFITEAVMIASGAVWAKDLWGGYWAWDPVETWSLVSWLIYGVAIHLRLTMGWKGRRFAWVAIWAIIGVLVTAWGVNLVVESSMHIFNVR
jgi:cytochrome c-type biogenesis protein CcsB